MFRDVLSFELHYLLRRPAIYFCLALFLLVGFFSVASDTFSSGSSLTAAARNSPFEIVKVLGSFSVLGLLVVAGFVATAVSRDRQYGVEEIFYSTPVAKGSYLGGRFVGALIVASIAVGATAVTMMLAGLMPWLDPARIVPLDLRPYLYALGVLVIPNLFLTGAIVFAVATLTRRVLLAYVVVIALVALWIVARKFTADLGSRSLAAILDPFGLTSFRVATQYWTVAEKNTMLPALDGALILNRALWMSVGLGFLVLTWARFRMSVFETVSRFGAHGGRTGAAAGGGRGITGGAPERAGAETPPIPIPSPTLVFNRRTWLRQWLGQTRIEITGVVRSVPFLLMLFLAFLMLVTGVLSEVAGTRTYPLTRVMVEEIAGVFELFLVLVLIIYAGQLVWRERAAGMHEIHSATPVPNWIPITAKVTALGAVSVAMLTAAAVATIVIQMAKGYTDFELGLYARGLFAVALPHWLMIGALAIAVQVFTPKKIVGFLVALACLETLEWFPEIGLEHHLNLFSTTPEVVYSDMNGYGHFVAPFAWFNVYWGFLTAALVIIAGLFWVRATDAPARLRIREARRRLNRAGVAGLAAVFVGFAATGAWIFYNTNVLNLYVPEKKAAHLTADYETRYKRYEALAQPRVIAVSLEADIYPDARRVDVSGDLLLVNKTDETIDELHVRLDPELEWGTFGLPDDALEVDDRVLGYRIYRLEEALAPGDSLDFDFEVAVANEGFRNHDSDMRVVGNGTFLSNFHVLPTIGYSRHDEIEDPNVRRRHGLPPRQGMPAPDDPVGRMNTMGADSDWISYRATLSTAEDQIAVTAGYLEREWTENGRRYFSYSMDSPILNFFPILSARYEVARDRWNDVAIEIYYDSAHAYNVDRMIASIKRSLSYYTENFGPYQHRQVRILEFPLYRTFAQSFPNTIPYSEAIHFVDDLRDPESIDRVFNITAHEVAHQWWGHQVTAARVQGNTFIEESLAQYSALMVTEKEYGREVVKRFLEYELDQYLVGRGRERGEEMPLALVEDQGYIHYRKGSVAMYALREYIGEEALNAALRGYVERVAHQEPPYTNSLELIAALKDATPEEYAYLIEDLFETITLYDNRIDSASVEATGDGRYRVRLEVESRKLRADGKGVEREIEHHDWIEIGVYGERDGEEIPLYLEKHCLESGNSAIEVVVDERPVAAGIDPRNLLIDRMPEDNLRPIAG